MCLLVYLLSFSLDLFYLFPILTMFSRSLIGLEGRVFTNGPGYQSSIPGRVIPNTLKMVLDTYLLNT